MLTTATGNTWSNSTKMTYGHLMPKNARQLKYSKLEIGNWQ